MGFSKVFDGGHAVTKSSDFGQCHLLLRGIEDFQTSTRAVLYNFNRPYQKLSYIPQKKKKKELLV